MSLPASLLADALRLAPLDRASLVDELVRSLDQPDHALEALWQREAESRLEAFQRGDIQAVDAAKVFAALQRRAT